MQTQTRKEQKSLEIDIEGERKLKSGKGTGR